MKYQILTLLFIFLFVASAVTAQNSTHLQCDTIETKSNFFSWLKNTIGAKSAFSNILNDNQKNMTQDELEANYIYYLSKFIKWNSAPPNAYFTIGIYGNTQVDEYLTKLLKSKGEQNQKWVIIHYKKTEELKNISCLMLYIADRTDEKVNQILKATKDKPVVTIGSNIQNFCKRGGIIHINSSDAPKKFDVNLPEAQRKDIKIQTQILMSSRIVPSE